MDGCAAFPQELKRRACLQDSPGLATRCCDWPSRREYLHCSRSRLRSYRTKRGNAEEAFKGFCSRQAHQTASACATAIERGGMRSRLSCNDIELLRARYVGRRMQGG